MPTSTSTSSAQSASAPAPAPLRRYDYDLVTTSYHCPYHHYQLRKDSEGTPQPISSLEARILSSRSTAVPLTQCVCSVPLVIEFDCAPQGSNFYRCRVCRLKFRRGKGSDTKGKGGDFGRHLLTHREDANLYCTWPGCTLSYPTRKSLAKHLDSHQVCFPTSSRCSCPAHIHLEIIHLSCIFLLVLVVLQPAAIVLFHPSRGHSHESL
jgi:hypothetical protein